MKVHNKVQQEIVDGQGPYDGTQWITGLGKEDVPTYARHAEVAAFVHVYNSLSPMEPIRLAMSAIGPFYVFNLHQCGLMDQFRETLSENTTESYCLFDTRLRYYLSTIMHMDLKEMSVLGECEFGVCKLDAYIAQSYDEWLCSLFD